MASNLLPPGAKRQGRPVGLHFRYAWLAAAVAGAAIAYAIVTRLGG